MARPPLAMNRFARDAAEDTADARDRRALRMGAVALDLRQCVAARDLAGIQLLLCVAARDLAGIQLLLCGKARTVPDKHAVSIILADLLNAALGLPATPEAVAEVGKIKGAAKERAA